MRGEQNPRPAGDLGELQPFQFQPIGVNVGKVVLRLLNKPAFSAAAENLGQSHGNFRRYAALSFTSSESVVRVTPRAAAAVMLRPIEGVMVSKAKNHQFARTVTAQNLSLDL
jgi:hypothetical protein